ncbi:MAG: ABC transporter permease [Clostridiales bacterium]|jgi:spermidine/putrescine transport system permease protein|nr:ABC transporter permease [Clostridiales bacterium]
MTKLRPYRFKRQQLAFPYMLITAALVIVPLFILLYYACTDYATGKVSLMNFAAFFIDRENTNLATLGRSFFMAFLTTVICLGLGYPLAYVLSRSPFNRRGILIMIFIMPMWINSLLRMFAVKNMMELFGVGSGFGAVLTGMVYDFFPFMLLPLFTSLSNIDRSYDEASNDLGATPLVTFIKVTLPLSVPGIISGVLMVFMPTISTFAVVEMLGSQDQNMLGNLINENISFAPTRNVGAAYAFILLILVAATMLIANLAGGKQKGREAANLL